MRKLFLVITLAMLFLSACNGTSTQPAPTPTSAAAPAKPTIDPAELEITNPANPIEVDAGKEFTITVRTNPFPDYHWEVAEQIDSSIVQYVWKDHVADNPSNSEVSGKDIWRFKAVAPGKTTITLGYYYADTDTTAKTEAFTIVVK